MGAVMAGPTRYENPNGDESRRGGFPEPDSPDWENGHWHRGGHNAGWSWRPGETPEDPNFEPAYNNDVDEYGYDAMHDPTQTPEGRPNPNYDPDPPPPDVTPPELDQVWDTAPHIPGEDVDIQQGSGDPGASDAPPPVHQRYTVSPGSIRDAENEILVETDRQVQYYESFRDYVNSTKHWIFGFSSEDDLEPYNTRAGVQTPIDPNERVTEDMVAIQDNALLAVASSIVITGQLVAMLNNGAQAYARTDLASFMPEADSGPPAPDGSGDSQ
jgi:hypothetical protein